MGQLAEIVLEITHACPMSCVHCSSFNEGEPHLDPSKYVPEEELKQTIEQFAGMGGQKMVFSGGEPLLHPNLLDLVRYAGSCRLDVRLFSSGLMGLRSRERREMSQDFATELRAAGLSRIEFNLQGARAETHERISRTSGSFRIVLLSVANAKAAGLSAGIHFVPMRENYTELEELVSLARDMNIDGVSILRFVPQGRGQCYRNRLELEPRQFLELLRTIARLRSGGAGVTIRTGCPMNFVIFEEEGREPVSCGAAKNTAVMLWDGSLVPCAAFKQSREFVAGNVLEKTVEEVWRNSTVLHQLRKIDSREVGGDCPECSRLGDRDGLCHAQRLLTSGSIHRGHDPHCPSRVLQSLSGSGT